MAYLAITALSILILMSMWIFLLKKTILDHHRDNLFDLRDEAREFFYKRNQLGTPIYRHLRILLNREIAVLDKFSLLGFVTYCVFLEEDKELYAKVKQDSKLKFSCGDIEVDKFVTEIRVKSSYICSRYMIYSSFPALCFFYLVVISKTFLMYFNHNQFKASFEKARHLFPQKLLKQDRVEGISLIHCVSS